MPVPKLRPSENLFDNRDPLAAVLQQLKLVNMEARRYRVKGKLSSQPKRGGHEPNLARNSAFG